MAVAVTPGVKAIGSADLVLGLGLLGIDGVAVTDAEEARRALAAALAEDETTLVLVDEAWVDALRGPLESAAQEVAAPLVVELPSATGADAALALHHRLEGALGIALTE